MKLEWLFISYETQLRIMEFIRFEAHSILIIIMYTCGLGGTEIVVDLGLNSKNCSYSSIKLIYFYNSSTANLWISVSVANRFVGTKFTVFFLNCHVNLSGADIFLTLRFLEIGSGHSI